MYHFSFARKIRRSLSLDAKYAGQDTRAYHRHILLNIWTHRLSSLSGSDHRQRLGVEHQSFRVPGCRAARHPHYTLPLRQTNLSKTLQSHRKTSSINVSSIFIISSLPIELHFVCHILKTGNHVHHSYIYDRSHGHRAQLE